MCEITIKSFLELGMIKSTAAHHTLMLVTSRPVFFLAEAADQQVPGHWPIALCQDSLKTLLRNSEEKPLLPALCFAEYHGYEHCFIVRKLLDLSQPQEHLRGPFRGMLSERVDRLNHMAPVKSHAEP